MTVKFMRAEQVLGPRGDRYLWWNHQSAVDAKGLAVARCMVNTFCATIPIKMYNPSDSDVHVWRCMTIGRLEPVLGHQRYPPTKVMSNVTKSRTEVE